VVYVPGNHDRPFRDHDGLTLGNVEIRLEVVHETADGRKLLVLHGDEFDAIMLAHRWLAFVGDLGYQFLLSLNPLINFVRRRFGLGYWSLSAYAKKRVKDAVNFIGEFESAIVRYAEKYAVDAVLCGHIHSAGIRQFGAVTYYNCGDWVESCTALVENHDGTFEIVKWK
jgi:UDP-2,3-diacylglucosamine pyrophosphatase LpxH